MGWYEPMGHILAVIEKLPKIRTADVLRKLFAPIGYSGFFFSFMVLILRKMLLSYRIVSGKVIRDDGDRIFIIVLRALLIM